MTVFRGLVGDADERYVPLVVPWVHEAGNPYYDWFFGDAATARSVLRGRLTSPRSEVALWRTTLLTSDDGRDVLGGSIALSGAELRRSRGDDAIAFLRAVGPDRRKGLLERVRASRELFAPVDDDTLYLSKVGVRADARGVGHGRALVERFLADGRARGHRRFRLDVHAGSRRAVRLYETAGFRVWHERHSVQAGMTYLAMGLDTDDRPRQPTPATYRDQ